MLAAPVYYVRIPVFCQLTGYTADAVDGKVRKGVWGVEAKWRKRPTVRPYVEGWQAANTRLKPSTLNGYRKIFNRYWLAWFGDHEIGNIRYSQVAVKLGAGTWKSNKTYNNVLAC